MSCLVIGDQRGLVDTGKPWAGSGPWGDLEGFWARWPGLAPPYYSQVCEFGQVTLLSESQL